MGVGADGAQVSLRQQLEGRLPGRGSVLTGDRLGVRLADGAALELAAQALRPA